MLFCAVTDDILHNVVLNKPSHQVSTYNDQFDTHGASLANDGIVNSCVRSQRETNPWWTIDLGDETLVAQVNLLNSGDNAGSIVLILSVFRELTTTYCIFHTVCI